MIIFSVSTLRDSLGFTAECRPDSTKNPFKPSRLAQTFHASGMSVWPALCRQSGGGLIWFGLEDGLDQQPRYLIYTKHNNTEHRVRLDLLVSKHPQVARSEFVVETAIHPFNCGSLSIALNYRMDITGSVGRFTFSCQRFLQAPVASRVRVKNPDTVIPS